MLSFSLLGPQLLCFLLAMNVTTTTGIVTNTIVDHVGNGGALQFDYDFDY